MSNTQETGVRFSKAEARKILEHCKKIRDAVDRLERDAIRSLNEPLKVVK